jgi:hypothetical protein
MKPAAGEEKSVSELTSSPRLSSTNVKRTVSFMTRG